MISPNVVSSCIGSDDLLVPCGGVGGGALVGMFEQKGRCSDAKKHPGNPKGTECRSWRFQIALVFLNPFVLGSFFDQRMIV